MFGDNLYEISNGFNNLLTNPNITYEDIGYEDEKEQIIVFLRAIKYDVGVSEKSGYTYKTNEHIIEARRNRYLGRHLIDHNNQRSCHVNGLVERFQLPILETKAGLDSLYDKMLKISKQLLSMNIINQEHLDFFVFIMVNNGTTRHN